MDILSLFDVIISPIYLIIIYFVSRMVQKRKIGELPEYRYYLQALSLKLVGGITFCLVYVFYYGGGDTTQYFLDSITVTKLLFKNPPHGFDVIINGLNRQNLSYFDYDTGYPVYFRDTSTSFVVQLTSLLTMIGLRSYIATTILVAWVSFQGIWNLYRVFLNEFPQLSKQVAIAIFFIPSTLFWGSGILKDTFTLSAVGYFTFSFYKCFIKRESPVRHFIILTVASYIIIVIKSYIFFALLPGALIWLGTSLIHSIRGKFLRYTIAPFTLLIMIAGAYLLIQVMGDSFGKFSPDQILSRAVISQRDLKSDYYRGNSFDIGEFDSNIGSILGVSHKALIAGLFRPFIWQANNIMMIMSGLENLFFLMLAIAVLYKTKLFGFFRYFFIHPLLTFSLVFSLFFAFSVGLSTSNYGSLVRYKIPAIPFFTCSMYIILHLVREEKKNRIQKAPELVLKPTFG